MHRSVGVSLRTAIGKGVWAVVLTVGISCILPQVVRAQYADQQQQQGNQKLSTNVGNVQIGLYGELIVNLSGSDETVVGGDVPLWAVPSSGNVTFPDGSAGRVHDFYLTARQSFIGLRAAPMTTGNWKPSVVVEFDFFGTRPSDTFGTENRVFNQPRLRIANFQLSNGNWKFEAGQDKLIIAPLDPISLSHVGMPLGASAGDLWGWLPQVRVERTLKFSDKTTGLLQVGVLRPEFGDPRLSDTPTAGTTIETSSPGSRSSMPFYQARAAISHAMNGSTATVGAGGHYGREILGATTNHIDTWAFAFDFRVPVQTRLILRGEGYVGSNLVPFQGGVVQGVAAIPNVTPAVPFTQINKISDAGGWSELTVRVTTDDKNHAYIGFGTDDPKDRNLLPGSTRSKNSFYWVSYLHKLTNELSVMAEWSNWQFRTRGFAGNIPSTVTQGRANVFNVSFGYTF